MAKKVKTDSAETMAPKGAFAFAKMLNKETGSEAFNKSKYTTVSTYIDTGNMALNRIISGSIYKGMPSGCICLFSGEYQTSKTLQSFLIAKNALEKNGYQAIIYVDSEGGANRGMLESVGINMDLVQYVPVKNIEDCTIKLITIYKTIATYQQTDPDFRALVILDSLGGLVSEKVLLDADKDKVAGDLGQSSKKISSMLRSLTMQAKISDCGMIILSQQYADPNSMFPSKIQNIRGGKAAYYQPSLIVQLSRRLEKGESKDDNFYESSVLKYFTAKTRNDVRPFLETEAVLSFKNGFKGFEYFGLIPSAIQLGFIKNPKQGYYQVPTYSEKLLRLKELYGGPKAKEIWDTFIDDYDKASGNEISYKSLANDNSETMQELKDEIKAKGFSLDFSENEEDSGEE